jgi:hypothetical protein
MVIIAWQANNIKSTSKRAVASAITLMGSGLGGMVSGGAFKTSASPLYQVRRPLDNAFQGRANIAFGSKTGIYLSLGLYFCSVVVIAGMETYFWRMNKAAREGKRQLEGMEDWYYTY